MKQKMLTPCNICGNLNVDKSICVQLYFATRHLEWPRAPDAADKKSNYANPFYLVSSQIEIK